MCSSKLLSRWCFVADYTHIIQDSLSPTLYPWTSGQWPQLKNRGQRTQSRWFWPLFCSIPPSSCLFPVLQLPAELPSLPPGSVSAARGHCAPPEDGHFSLLPPGLPLQLQLALCGTGTRSGSICAWKCASPTPMYEMTVEGVSLVMNLQRITIWMCSSPLYLLPTGLKLTNDAQLWGSNHNNQEECYCGRTGAVFDVQLSLLLCLHRPHSAARSPEEHNIQILRESMKPWRDVGCVV